MKRKTKQNATPEQILKNLRSLINEAEEILHESGEQVRDEHLVALRDRIQESFNRLREASSNLGGRVRDYSSDFGDRMKDYYGDAEERLRDYYEDIEERLKNSAEITDQTLRAHPYQMAAVTFGLGIAVGAIMRVAGKSR